MLFIYCKVQLKLKCTNYAVLASNRGNNADANWYDIIITIKGAKVSVPVVILLAKDNQKLSTLLSNVFEKSAYWNEYKTKIESENTTNEYG